jgi:hypothetical protein
MSRNRGTRWALALAVLGALAGARAAVAAQEATTGTIAGQVVDAQGLAIPGATVTVTGARGTKTAVTNAEGGFLVPFVDVHGAEAVRRSLGPAVLLPLGAAVGHLRGVLPQRQRAVEPGHYVAVRLSDQ